MAIPTERSSIGPLTIGVTGPIGCGKSTVARWLGERPGVVVVDADKVARISAQIADGSFKINPEAIADKLIANAQELLAKVQG